MAGVKGKSGRPRKTLNEREKLGDHRRRNRTDDCPARVEARPAQFGQLSEEALAVWEWFEPMLYQNGTLGAADGLALTVLCETAGHWDKYRKIVQERGREVPIRDDSGRVIDTKIAVWTKLEQEYRKELVAMLREFGMTPQARSSIAKIAGGEDPRKIPSVT